MRRICPSCRGHGRNMTRNLWVGIHRGVVCPRCEGRGTIPDDPISRAVRYALRENYPTLGRYERVP